MPRNCGSTETMQFGHHILPSLCGCDDCSQTTLSPLLLVLFATHSRPTCHSHTHQSGKINTSIPYDRGMAQPIRYTLEYMKLPYKDVLYAQGSATSAVPFDKSCWFNEKENHKQHVAFPNLPYLYHGSVRLTQSQCILRYISRLRPEMKMLGGDLESQTRVDQVLAEFVDRKFQMTQLMYQHGLGGPAMLFMNGQGYDALPATLGRFSSYLADRPFFADKDITVADFVMYEYLDCAEKYSDAMAKDYTANAVTMGNASDVASLFLETPNLKEFKNRIESLPAMGDYLSSDRFKELRDLNNQHAKFK